MSAPETAISAAFVARLKALATLPQHPDGQAVNRYPESVAWENATFTPAIGTPYLKPHLLPGEPFQAEIGTDGANRHLGVYQISVFAPQGQGTAVINALRDAVVEHFKRGTMMEHSGITVKVEKAYPSGAITEAPWIHIPITIRYRVDSAN